MRRTLAVLSVVFLAVLLLATPGLVAAKGGQGGISFNVYGKIAGDPDDEAETFLVTIASPIGLAGETVIVQVTADTHLKECDSGRIDFETLDDGDAVRVKGAVEGDIYVASVVILNPATVP